MKPSTEKKENETLYWEFEEDKTLRSIPYSEDYNLPSKQSEKELHLLEKEIKLIVREKRQNILNDIF